MEVIVVTPTHDARSANWPILAERLFPQGVEWRLLRRPEFDQSPEPAYEKLNWWLDRNPPSGRYVHFVMDDELMPPDFYARLEPVPITFCLMLRGDHSPERSAHRHATNPLFAPKVGHCGLLQVVFRDDVLAGERFALTPTADGELIERVCQKWPVSYRPDVPVFFNALEAGRWNVIP